MRSLFSDAGVAGSLYLFACMTFTCGMLVARFIARAAVKQGHCACKALAGNEGLPNCTLCLPHPLTSEAGRENARLCETLRGAIADVEWYKSSYAGAMRREVDLLSKLQSVKSSVDRVESMTLDILDDDKTAPGHVPNGAP